MSQTLLVTGAGGALGRLVIDNLVAAHAGKIIAGSRDPAKLTDFAAKGVELRKVDFDDPALAESFVGVDRLLIISTDALDVPGHRLRQHEAAVAAAVKAGVKHIVYTSMPKPEPGSAIAFAPDHYGSEQAIKASGIGYTILRNNWYFENLKMSLPGVLASGQWFTSAGKGKIANLSREDLAVAAAVALAASFDGRRTLTLTGAEALTTEEIAATASAVFAKPIAVVHLSDEQLAEGLKQHGLPPHMVSFVVSFDANTRLGGVAEVTDDFTNLTGRTLMTLRDYFAAHKAEYL